MRAAETAFLCRQAAAELFQVESPEQVVFTSNATHGLNLAIHSLLKPGDAVVISGYEHNAVTRPLHALGVNIRVAAGPLFDPEAQVRAFERQLDETVRAVICNHVSNVFGFILPVEGIAALCRERGIPFVLDASQSAGCLPVHMGELGAAFVAMPGHKGLYGPQGTGLLAARGILAALEGKTMTPPPADTMCGALIRYITSENKDFQPMGSNMGILPPLETHIRDKRERYAALADRAVADMKAWLEAQQ